MKVQRKSPNVVYVGDVVPLPKMSGIVMLVTSVYPTYFKGVLEL